MKIFYHRAATGNVGDDLNAVLWPRLIPDLEQVAAADWLVGIGTIIDHRLMDLPGRKIVVGSGFRPQAKVARFSDDVHFACVRGPLSAERLGLPASCVACDPGFLIATWPELQCPRHSPVALVPHVYTEARTQIATLAQAEGLEVISPALPVDQFLRRLAGCQRVFTESLHGAIFADALRIPWARVKISSHFYEGGVSDFKWKDAFAPLGVQPIPFNVLGTLPIKRTWPRVMKAFRPVHNFFEQRLIARLARLHDRGDCFQLSSDGRVARCTGRLLEKLGQTVGEAALRPQPV